MNDAWGSQGNRIHQNNLSHSVSRTLVSMHIYIKFEGSVINHKGRRGNYRTKEKWLKFKHTGQNDQLYHMHVHVHFWAKYKISMIKPADRTDHRQWWQRQHGTDNSRLHRLFGIYAKWANYTHTQFQFVTIPHFVMADFFVFVCIFIGGSRVHNNRINCSQSIGRDGSGNLWDTNPCTSYPPYLRCPQCFH